MAVQDLVVPLGILTYLTATTTLITGLKRVNVNIHKILAYLTLGLATLHAGLVIYLKYFS